MAQIIYTTVPVSTGSSPVEVDLQNLFPSAVVLNNSEAQDNSIVVDEADVFQCGRCRKNFTFPDFVFHKKSNCQGIQLNVHESSSLIQPCQFDEIGAENNQIILDNSELLNLVNNNSKNNINVDDDTSLSQPTGIDNHLIETNVDDLKTYQIVDDSTDFQETLLQNGFTSEQNEILSGETNKNEEGQIYDEATVEREKTGDSYMKAMKCSYCDKQFRKNFDLQTHIRSHTGEKPFQCIVCGRAFTQKSNVIKHMSTHKVWPKEKSTLPSTLIELGRTQSFDKRVNERLVLSLQQSFVCQYCPTVLKSYLEWKTHMKTHTSQKVYKCVQDYCGATFSDLDRFLSHVHIHKEKSRYTCHLCLVEFDSLDALGQHQFSHEKTNLPKRVMCRKCSARIIPGCHQCPLEAVSKHHACPICNRSFVEERFLRRHLVIVHSPSQYQCHHCEKSYKTRQYLNAHIKAVHSAIRPHVCNICSSSFSSRDKLIRHGLTHEKVKRFKCPFLETKGCKKEFNRKDKLKQHLLTHRDKSKDTKTNDKLVRKNTNWTSSGGTPTIEIYVIPVNSPANVQDHLGMAIVP